jgi:transcriptional regulator with XRE-family HTH domain
MGPRIREKRDELGYPRRFVADKVAQLTGRKYRENWLSGIERGDTGIYLNAAIALADVLGMSLDEMVGRRTGPDVVIEGTAMDIKQQVTDAAVAPLEEAVQGLGTPEPIPLEPARRGRRGEGGRQRRT